MKTFCAGDLFTIWRGYKFIRADQFAFLKQNCYDASAGDKRFDKISSRGVICVHNKKRIPWLGDNENYSERRYSDAVSLSFQAPNFGQREYNRSRSGPRGFETTDFQSQSSGESPYRLRSEIKSDQIVFIQLHTDLSEIQFTPDNSTTLAKSNLVLTRTKIDFPWFFLYIYGNFTRGNSNTR